MKYKIVHYGGYYRLKRLSDKTFLTSNGWSSKHYITGGFNTQTRLLDWVKQYYSDIYKELNIIQLQYCADSLEKQEWGTECMEMPKSEDLDELQNILIRDGFWDKFDECLSLSFFDERNKLVKILYPPK